MVLSPKDLEARVLESDSTEIARREEWIDEALVNSGQTSSIYLNGEIIRGNLHKKSIKKLLDKYRDAGWSVSYQSGDFREPEGYYIFSPKRQRSQHEHYGGRPIETL